MTPEYGEGITVPAPSELFQEPENREPVWSEARCPRCKDTGWYLPNGTGNFDMRCDCQGTGQEPVAPVVPVGSEAPRVIERRECGRCGAEVRPDKTRHFCGVSYPLKATEDVRVVRYVAQGTGHERVIPATDLRSLRDHAAYTRSLAGACGNHGSCHSHPCVHSSLDALVAKLDEYTAKTPSGECRP